MLGRLPSDIAHSVSNGGLARRRLLIVRLRQKLERFVFFQADATP